MTEKRETSSKGFRFLMITVFLGALNDNLFRLFVLFIALREFVTNGDDTFYYSLVGALFLLPFILFSPYAGWTADRFSKRKVIISTKLSEIILMSSAAWFLISYNISGLFVILFLMGMQSTFFSPVKYGILPEILSHEQLSKANGYMEFWTFIAIIMGTSLAGFLMSWAGENLLVPGLTVMTLALLGLISSYFISKTEPEKEDRPFKINPFRDVFNAIKEIRETRLLFYVILGISYFWFIGSLYQLNIPLYAQLQLLLDELGTGIILTALALGIGLGCIAAGHFSRGRIELKFVPMGAIGISIASGCLFFTTFNLYVAIAVILLLGFSSGFFIVPCSAYLQHKSPEARRGRFIAASNFLAFSAMFAAPVLLWVLTDFAGLESTHLFLLFGLISLMVAIYAARNLKRWMEHEGEVLPPRSTEIHRGGA